MNVIWILLGLALLLGGGELLVRGAADLALRFKISPWIIGLTIVSFSTSAPELLVSIDAAIKGFPDVAIGNVVGSNIVNIGFILALTAMFFKFDVEPKALKFDMPILIFFTLVYYILIAADGETGWLDGVVLFSLIVIYVGFLVHTSRKDNKIKFEAGHEFEAAKMHWVKSTLLLLVGLLLLKYGASFLVEGAVALASGIGISERVIGLTIVAIGTSLPELAASLVSAYRGQREMSLGNIVGSNIFNIGSVIGVSSMITPLKASSSQMVQVDFPAMMLFTLILPFLILIGKKGSLNLWKASILLAGYIMYIIILF